jgi:hypothetical protein
MDALAPFGVVHADMPLTPANVWLAIQAGQDPEALPSSTPAPAEPGG